MKKNSEEDRKNIFRDKKNRKFSYEKVNEKWKFQNFFFFSKYFLLLQPEICPGIRKSSLEVRATS